MKITFNSIGTIHTPFKIKEGMPIQSKRAIGIKGQVIIKEELAEGLSDLDGFSHIILIYYFHKSEGFELKTTPFLDQNKRGVFSTRAPRRPNSIGISIVRLLSIEGNILNIENVDMLDGTPLLDIKPYVSYFDIYEVKKNGWIESKKDKLNEF